MEDLYLQACEEGATHIVCKYLRKGLDVNYRDQTGLTGLMRASLNGNYELAKLLLESDADVNLTDYYGHNALHYATIGNNERICKLLCHSGVDSNKVAKTTQMLARDYSLRAVSQDQPEKVHVVKEYLKRVTAMNNSEEDHNFINRKDQPKNKDERIFDIILRYENMNLSGPESDGDGEVKGKVYVKPKKKKTAGKKKAGAKKTKRK